MFDVRACADQGEYNHAIGAIGQYFNPPPSEELLERFTRTLPHERMHAAFEDDEIVGGAGAFPFELSVPGGGSLPCAGVTAVGVHPTHRRRGVLRSMMDAQLRDIRERGEPLAALWASEETIYNRFGYGIASWAGELKIPHEWDAFAQPFEPVGTVRFVTPGDAVTERSVVGRSPAARRGRRKRRATPLRAARGRRRAAGVRDLPDTLRLRGRPPGVAARRPRGLRRDAAGDGGHLALSARRRLDGGRRGRVPSAGSSVVPAAGDAPPGPLPDG